MSILLNQWIRLLTISRRPISKDFCISLHSHPWWQYLLIEDGEIFTMVEDDYSVLSNDQAAMMPGDKKHGFYARTDAQIIELKFLVEDPSLQQALLTAKPIIGHINDKAYSTLSALLREGIEQDLYYNEMIALLLSQMLLHHLRQQHRKSPIPTTPVLGKVDQDMAAIRMIRQSSQANTVNNHLSEIVQYMADQRDRDLSLDDIARRFGYSPNYLCQLFSSSIGISPMKFLTLLRLDRAKDLIKNTDEPIERISDLSGFSSTHQMWRVFKSETGHSPSEYRRLYADNKSTIINFTGHDEKDWVQLFGL